MHLSRLMCFAFVGGFLVSGSSVVAATINLDTGKTLSVSAGGTGSLTFSATNVDAGDTQGFASWVLGLQVIPTVGNTGTLSLGTLSQAASNSMPVSPVSVVSWTQGTLVNPENGTTVFYSMSIEADENLGTLVSGRSYNLGTLSFNASSDALGLWNVFAVQEGTSPTDLARKTYWNDLSNGTELVQTQFGNLAFGQGTTSLQLGTITVVPEPTSAGLLVVAIGAAAMVRRRRQRGEVQPKKKVTPRDGGSLGMGA